MFVAPFTFLKPPPSLGTSLGGPTFSHPVTCFVFCTPELEGLRLFGAACR